jgi:hypothetical protein
VEISIKEVQQTYFMKSSGNSKEVEALIGSITDQENKYYNAKTIRTLRQQYADIRLATSICVHMEKYISSNVHINPSYSGKLTNTQSRGPNTATLPILFPLQLNVKTKHIFVFIYIL